MQRNEFVIKYSIIYDSTVSNNCDTKWFYFLNVLEIIQRNRGNIFRGKKNETTDFSYDVSIFNLK